VNSNGDATTTLKRLPLCWIALPGHKRRNLLLDNAFRPACGHFAKKDRLHGAKDRLQSAASIMRIDCKLRSPASRLSPCHVSASRMHGGKRRLRRRNRLSRVVSVQRRRWRLMRSLVGDAGTGIDISGVGDGLGNRFARISLAFAVPSAPQFGQPTATGIRPLTGSTSN